MTVHSGDDARLVDLVGANHAQPTVCAALASVMSDVREVAKGDASGQGYSFRGIDAVLTAVAPALRRHQVVVVPVVESVEYVATEARSGSQMTRCRVVVVYRWYGPQGDHVEARVAAEAADSSDKATSKAMSIAFRTALLQVLALPVADAMMITPSQLKAMMAAFGEAGLRERTARLEFTNALLDREVASARELTVDEAGLIIEALREAMAEDKSEAPT